MTRLKRSPHWLQTQVHWLQTLGPVRSALICNAIQESVLSLGPPWALVGTISGSPQQERREEQFYSLPSRGRRRNQIIKCEKQRRKREKGLGGRTFLHDYLPEATCSGVQLASGLAAAVYSRKGPAAWKRQRRRPWQKRMARLLNAPPGKHRRLSGPAKSGMSSSSGTTSIRGPSWMGSLAVCIAWAPMICLTRPSNSIDWLCHRSSGRRGVDPSPLSSELIAVAMVGGTVVKMIVSLSGLCVEVRGLNHIIIRKPSGAAQRFILPQQDGTRVFFFWSPWSDMSPLLDLDGNCWKNQREMKAAKGNTHNKKTTK